mmetsp:Transcript_20596/g.58391  ORF Transcript_20596/g.58391 Transcript_20596/m.58391 type:complete len:236 (+) Transcript_20596:204-911(+)
MDTTSCQASCAERTCSSEGTVVTASTLFCGGRDSATPCASCCTPRRTRSGFASTSKLMPWRTLSAASMTRGAWPSMSTQRMTTSMPPAAAMSRAEVRESLSRICSATCTASPDRCLQTSRIESKPLRWTSSLWRATRSRSESIARMSRQTCAQCAPSWELIASADKAHPNVASPGPTEPWSTSVVPSARGLRVACVSDAVTRRMGPSSCGWPALSNFVRRSWSAAQRMSNSVSWL